MKYLFSLLDIMVAICKWSSIAMAIFVFVSMLHIKKTQNLTAKDWIALISSGLYAIIFLGLLIYDHQIHDSVFSTLSLLAMFIACVWTRYEDKRDNRRWWNW